MNIRNFVLGVGIVVIYALVLWQGTEAFYPSPQYDDFCSFRERIPLEKASGTDCVFPEEVRERQNACFDIGGEFRLEYDGNGCVVDGVCDECRINYEDTRKSHSQIVFIISLIVAVVTLFAGFVILSIEPVGSALISSGIWAIFWGSAINWANFSNVLRFVLLLSALAVIILFTLWVNSKKKKKGFKFDFKFRKK